MKQKSCILLTIVLSLALTACGGNQSSADIEATVAARVQATLAAPTVTSVSTSTPMPSPTATPTPIPPISEEAIAYFRGMLINPSAIEMLDLTPPSELKQLHLELVQKKGDVESATSLMISAALSGGSFQFQSARALAEAASSAYDITDKRVRLAWEEYLSRYNLNFPTIDYKDIAFTNPDNGWIVGSQGTILHYDGQNWHPFNSPTEKNLVDIYMLDQSEGWIIGAEGTLLHYKDNAWQKVDNPSSQPYIVKLSVLGSNDVWMLASDLADENPTVEILQYDGSSWKQVASITGKAQLADFQMLDDQTGWVEYQGGQTRP